MRYTNAVDITRPINYACLQEYINELCVNFRFLQNIIIGKSYLGKNINLLKIGEGERKSIYIGAHHAMEWLTSLILMRFAETLCKSFTLGEKLYGYDLEYIFKSRTVYIIPMINPDGSDFFQDKLFHIVFLRKSFPEIIRPLRFCLNFPKKT